jgi:hypothetical protein
MREKKAKPRFKVGDWISLPHGGTGTVLGRVIEDRGPIGVKGRRLFRIEITWDDREPDRFEMPEEEMVLAEPPKSASKAS